MTRLRLHSLILISLLFSIFIEGCVTKSRYLAKEDENKTLVQQLRGEEKEKDGLIERLKMMDRQANIRGKEHTDLIKAQADQIAILEEQQEKTMLLREKIEAARLSLEQQVNVLRKKVSEKVQEASAFQGQLSTVSKKSMSLAERLSETEKIAQQKAHDAEETARARENLIHRLKRESEAMSEKSMSLAEQLADIEEIAKKKIGDAEETARTRKTLINSLQKEIAAGNVKISQMKDRLSVQIVDKILFPTGSAQVTGDGKSVLKKVSNTLKNINQKIRIEGHTDNVPIGESLISKFPSNWELSTSRATQVVRYLVKEAVNPKNLLAVGMAEYKPIASNDSPEGRQKNRRIEIILTPQ